MLASTDSDERHHFLIVSTLTIHRLGAGRYDADWDDLAHIRTGRNNDTRQCKGCSSLQMDIDFDACGESHA